MTDKIQFADLKDARIAYFDLHPQSPADKTILLIHGFASSAKVNWLMTGWSKTLLENGYRVVALDNRGHGESSKFYSPDDYGPDIFAADAVQLMDHLGLGHVDVLGYSMGARISAWLAWQNPERVRRAVFGGMGEHIFGGRGGYEAIAEGLETEDPSSITDKGAASFRKFADLTQSDRMALAACIRPAKEKITPEIVAAIQTPVLVAVGTDDDVGGSAEKLADMMPNAQAFAMPDLDHMKATGATIFKTRVLEFLGA
jgi:pimeloyl-ACP methyl ester carboxylesterase